MEFKENRVATRQRADNATRDTAARILTETLYYVYHDTSLLLQSSVFSQVWLHRLRTPALHNSFLASPLLSERLPITSKLEWKPAFRGAGELLIRKPNAVLILLPLAGLGEKAKNKTG